MWIFLYSYLPSCHVDKFDHFIMRCILVLHPLVTSYSMNKSITSFQKKRNFNNRINIKEINLILLRAKVISMGSTISLSFQQGGLSLLDWKRVIVTMSTFRLCNGLQLVCDQFALHEVFSFLFFFFLSFFP